MDSVTQPEPSERTLIPSEALEEKISELLDSFFRRRIDRLRELKLDERLRSKNPYLFRAIGVTDASGIVQQLLDAHISSSDETIFGNVFFEPLAKWVAEQSFKGQSETTVSVSGGEGVDIQLSDSSRNEAIAIKSGPKVFNAQSRRKQVDEFRKIDRILKKDKKLFLAIVGYCYGRKVQREARDFTEMAGQQLWAYLTGEDDFYLRIIRLMKTKPIEHRPQFIEQYEKAKNLFVREFLDKYSLPDGGVDWEKLVAMVSATRLSNVVGATKRSSKAKAAKATDL